MMPDSGILFSDTKKGAAKSQKRHRGKLLDIVTHTCNPEPGRQRQGDCYEVKVNLCHLVSFRLVRLHS